MKNAAIRRARRPRRTLSGQHRSTRTVGLAVLVFGVAAPLTAQVWEGYDFQALEVRGIGVEAGPVRAARVEPAFAYGLRLDLGLIRPRLRITPTARFWASSLQAAEVHHLARQIILVCERQGDVDCPDHLDLGEVQLSDLELALDAHYIFRGNRGASPFVGFGLALHLLNGRGDFIDGTFIEDLLDSVAPGLASLFGVNIQLAREFRLGSEARFMLASDVRYASVSLGGVWTLPIPGRGADSIRREGRR